MAQFVPIGSHVLHHCQLDGDSSINKLLKIGRNEDATDLLLIRKTVYHMLIHLLFIF